MIEMRNHVLIFLIFFLIILSCNDNSLKVSDHNSITHFKDTLNIKIKFIKDDQRKGKIESFFQKKFKQRQFNGNILFAENGQIITNKSYGFANFQEKEKLTQNHSFQLASVSKPFTAIAILQLIENGILTLNDTVEKFLPNFPYNGITIHQLLSHRSGLSQYTHFCDSPDSIWPDKNKTINNDDVIEIISKIKPLKNYPPNRRYYYCNTNFLLLASIVEKVTGITFREYLKSNIFSPLGMNHTVLYDRTNFEELILPTQGYENRTPWEDVYLNGVVGDKGIYSTTLDMFLFDQALNQNTLINDSLKKLAFSKMNKDYHQNKNYGYGFRLKTHKKFGKIVYHTGWWKGYRSYFIKIPQSNQTIIVLNNVKRGRFLNINQLIELIN
ncbi:MAG: serine hydrolase [Crocinitomicaceae bacterium]|nr:serine hydrolase [Crocinitomicaceae bacterium]